MRSVVRFVLRRRSVPILPLLAGVAAGLGYCRGFGALEGCLDRRRQQLLELAAWYTAARCSKHDGAIKLSSE
jgi:hypothetical protein